jgi:peptidyl-prolyl cis-trans isomerase D
MRDNFQQLKWALLAVVAAFIIGFVYVDMGLGGAGGSAKAADRSYAARVNGDAISTREYERALTNTERNYEQIYRQPLTQEMVQQMGLPRQVLDNLIDEHLLLQQAQRLHLNATPEEIRKAILEIPDLNPDGKFVGAELYNRYVTGFLHYTTAGEFEDEVAKAITLRKMETTLANSIVISPKAAEAEYRRVSENAKIRYALLPAARQAVFVTVSPQEVDAYYKTNQSKYTHGDQRDVKYLIADYTRIRATINPTDADLQKRYEATKNDFKRPAQAHILHILIKVDPNATPQQDAAAKAKADDLVKQLRAGADFGKLAQANSGDPSSSGKGGDMGWVDQGATVQPFDQAAFSIAPNTISDPIRSKEFGYHIIKVLERRAAGIKSFDEVKPQLAAQMIDQTAKDIARDEIAKVAQRLKANPPKTAAQFTALANDKVTSNDTQWFGKTDQIPGMGNNPALAQWAFGAKQNDVGEILGTPRGPAIPFLYGVRPAGVSSLEEIRAKVENDARMEKARQAARDAVAKAMPGSANVDAVAAKVGITATETNVTRQGYIGGFSGDTTPLVNAVFSTPIGQTAGPIVVGDGAVVFTVIDQKKVTPKDIADNVPQYADVLRQQEARSLKQSLLQRMRKSAKVDVNESLMQQQTGGGNGQQQSGM